jgi:ubiquinone biosynthesis protein
MLDQVGPKKLWQQLKDEAPRYAKLLPELPRLVHEFLKHRQNNNHALVDAMVESQRQTQRLVQRLLWAAIGFVVGLAAMQFFTYIH